MIKRIVAAAVTAASLALFAVPAAACGGLVAPNGAIRLSRATTMVDWHDGIERYMTSFSYQGQSFSDFGWIVPLPAVPLKVEEGGGWTLQRLNRETHPQPQFLALAGSAARVTDSAVVVQQVKVRALDITILKGSGQAIVDWCRQNGFLLNLETRDHLMTYAKGSPVFMAAKYNVARAAATKQLVGDGAPVLITMKLAHPWVPLEVLANGVAEVNADIYMITPGRIYTSDLAALESESPEGSFVPRAPGLAVPYQQPVSDELHRDLSSDKNMGWMQPGGWLTYITLTAPANTVTYDMGISGAGVIHVAAYGTPPMQVADGLHDLGTVVPAPPGTPDGPTLAPGMRTLLLQVASLVVILGAVSYATLRQWPRAVS